MRVALRLFCVIALALFLALSPASCGKRPHSQPPTAPGQPKPYYVQGRWYTPLPHARGFVQEGIASWYGNPFHGRKTSSGEVYDMHLMTCAHKTLPFGTLLRVDNLDNGRSCQVRVNDRGPFAKGRILDLSFAAAKELGMTGPGTARVRITALAAPAEKRVTDKNVFYTGNFTIQVGAFSDPGNARRLQKKLSARYDNAHVIRFFQDGRTFHRVRVGRASSLDQAEKLLSSVQRDGFDQAFVVAE
ncbi:MAG: septal ring lytic transglycosylase RlpA family protein [Deltaproteobacteria bacterium]|nr:septal ring lytic transglycosylase RlpA family protein [Deltaproteobacteria bacterium]